MRILKMTATFGCLNCAVLELKDGLNVIHAPNEFGKSTWTAFLIAMLYGIDTTQRTTKTTLPLKIKYQPWSGKPMAGTMEILWNEQEITLQRNSHSRTYMSDFKAFYTKSGQIIDEITGNNCGEYLLGVERSVFEKSGFIGQQALSVGTDNALEARLTSLVTTADEEISYTATRKKLLELRNRRRHHKTGLLPDLERQLLQLETTICDIKAMKQQASALEGEVLVLQENLQNVQTAMEQEHQQILKSQAKKLEEAKETMQKKQAIAHKFSNETRNLPDETQLPYLQDKMNKYAVFLTQQATQSEAFPQLPPRPTGFENVPPEQAESYVANLFIQLSSINQCHKVLFKPPFWPFIPTFSIGIILFFFERSLVLIPTFLCLAYGVYYLIGRYKANIVTKKQLDLERKSHETCKKFGVTHLSELDVIAKNYARTYEIHRQANENFQVKFQQFKAENKDFLRELQVFYPHLVDIPQGAKALQESACLLANAHLALQDFTTAKAHFQTLSALVAEPFSPDAPPRNTNFLSVYQHDYQDVLQKLQTLKEQLASLRGRLSTHGSLPSLQAEAHEKEQKIRNLEQEYRALNLAIEALDRANAQLQERFSPQLNQLASEFFGILTNQKYDTIFVGQSLALQTKETAAISTQSILYLSGGTLDQLYLSVRLAIHQLLLGDAAPLVLDDALAFFDDQRAKTAVELLKKIGRTRQIILFSCHNREKDFL